jgi:hypothetical protein
MPVSCGRRNRRKEPWREWRKQEMDQGGPQEEKEEAGWREEKGGGRTKDRGRRRKEGGRRKDLVHEAAHDRVVLTEGILSNTHI